MQDLPFGLACPAMPSIPSPVVSNDLRTVRVSAPARLHLGFLDPDASLGRAWGSLGLVIEGMDTEVSLCASNTEEVSAAVPASADEIARARRCLASLRRITGRAAPLRLRLLSLPPGHAGFGSGTQLALAIGRAFVCHHALDASTTDVAHWLGRGRRSGVGIAGFEQGGLLVDGGPGADGRPAPLLARVALPEAWHVVLVLDPHRRGLAGEDERRALAALPPLAREVAADICHQVLMRVLPGAATADFAAFAEGISHIQRRLGEHFAPVQQGRAFTSDAVARLVGWIGARRKAGLGQSSWGPTGFAIVPSQAEAEALLTEARAEGAIPPGLEVRIVRARNTGAQVEELVRRTD
jgi:beta-ribofuranosylaminobenzene 5'-phosphate synthase